MIFLHLLTGILLGKLFGNYFWFILGSLLPDVDHIYVILKHRLFSVKKIVDTQRFEDKYGIRYKTPFMHSLLGMLVFSLPAYLLGEGLPFVAGYLLHLLLDWPDIDEKYYLFPLKVRFRGFLEIWSKEEQIATVLSLIVLTLIYI